MTNAEKYKEVFGITPDPQACPTYECTECPCYDPDSVGCHCSSTHKWWAAEYKEV